VQAAVETEDLTSEIFLAVFRNIDDFRAESRSSAPGSSSSHTAG
jgi:DNA-directed RNA polymerase specialized sigma24 family protein